MSLSTLLNIPCSIQRRSLPDEDVPVDEENFDRHGNPIAIEPSDSDTDYAYEMDTLCWIQQERRTEAGDTSEMSDTFWTIFFPYGTALDSDDAVEVDGYGRFQLVGDAWEAKQGSSRVWHVEASARRTGPGELAS